MYFFMFQSDSFFHFFKAQINLLGHQTPILILKRKGRIGGMFSYFHFLYYILLICFKLLDESFQFNPWILEGISREVLWATFQWPVSISAPKHPSLVSN